MIQDDIFQMGEQVTRLKAQIKELDEPIRLYRDGYYRLRAELKKIEEVHPELICDDIRGEITK